MATKVFLKHKDKDQIKVGIVGFSWTTLFFGLFVPLFRKDFKVFLPFLSVYFIAFYFMPYTYSNIDGAVSFQIIDDLGIYNSFSSMYYIVVNILGAFFYNTIYTQSLVKKGFYPISSEGAIILQTYNINIPNNMYENRDK